MSNDSLFHTEIVNEDGISGEAYVKNGLHVTVSDPTQTGEGTNPEELLGLSWATCLNATLQAILKGRGSKSRSKVEVAVDYKREETGFGFYFELTAIISIENTSLEDSERFMKIAHRKCPVSKIIGEYPHISMKVVPYIS
ncbi:OsmC family protein [Jeotgalibaca ciconiae]|uniref:OsmC family peroxiredoxin n=1 Tax=Jeotgalibaca ciconiae TaxID=2496265 RepID=A0A3Q9BLT0_9LACT|nr:OsmC family protein [Jeotgalibaca ciconiae]AZP05412.1 OsmC family peroxiredoxin [Jeotgalibaca ciconiae]HJB24087.1 OsmC family protein [Candidatus Jeotgalibaca pullicola]